MKRKAEKENKHVYIQLRWNNFVDFRFNRFQFFTNFLFYVACQQKIR